MEREIHSIKVAGSVPLDPAAMSKIFRHKAEGYSQDMPGMQTFCLLAFYGEGTEPEARHPWRLFVTTDDQQALGTEAPTKTGMVQQAMRQTENLHQLLVNQTRVVIEAQKGIIEALGKQNSQLVNENADAFSIVREMIMRQDSDRHEHRIAEIKAKQQMEERQRLMKLAPALLNQVTGRQIFPEATESNAIFESLAETLTEQQLGGLAQLLTPQQLAIIGPKLQSIMQERQRAAQLAAQGTENPEADAAGD